jgi:hypothetical protein
VVLLLAASLLAASPFAIAAAARAQWAGNAAALVGRARNLLQHDPRTSAEVSGIPAAYAEGLRLLEEATNTAPQYAPAWLSLAEVAEMASLFDSRESPRLLDIAARASERAVMLDPTVAQGQLRNREYQKDDAKQRTTEIRVTALSKLDRSTSRREQLHRQR